MTQYKKIKGFVFLMMFGMAISIYAAHTAVLLPVKAFGTEKPTDEFRDIKTDDFPIFQKENETGSLSCNVYYDESEEPPEKKQTLLYGLLLMGGFVLGSGIVLLLKRSSSSKTGNDTASGEGYIRTKILSGCCLTKRGNFQLKQNLYIGTNKECDFRWKEETISDIHAKIYMHNGTVYIEDMNSSFGTAINGMRIYAPNKLRDADIISVGNAQFQIFL